MKDTIQATDKVILKYFLVPFEYCYSLIRNREFNLCDGNVEIYSHNWVRLLVAIYGTYLKIVVREMRYNKAIHKSLNDDRVRYIMKVIGENTSFQFGSSMNAEKFDINQIYEESRLFPLCMRNLYMSLIKRNRLAHNERLVIVFFLNCYQHLILNNTYIFLKNSHKFK